MPNSVNMKMMSYTYVSSKADYSKAIMHGIMTSHRIDKKSSEFENILFDFKRRNTTNFLLEVLMNNNVILLYNEKPMPKAFTVIGAKDIKEDKKTKVFVDCSVLFNEDDGKYSCKNIDQFIAIIMDAFINLVYYSDPRRFTNNSSLLISSTDCFVSLFTHILDYLRVNGFSQNKEKIEYIVALYFLCDQMCLDFNQSTKNIAMKVAGISPKDANIADILLPKDDNHFFNIDIFIKHLAEVFKLKDLTTEVFIEKWLWQYGQATQFGLEFLPTFLAMISDAYSGSYINNQQNIEKQCGKEMNNLYQSILKIGNDVYRKY